MEVGITRIADGPETFRPFAVVASRRGNGFAPRCNFDVRLDRCRNGFLFRLWCAAAANGRGPGRQLQAMCFSDDRILGNAKDLADFRGRFSSIPKPPKLGHAFLSPGHVASPPLISICCEHVYMSRIYDFHPQYTVRGLLSSLPLAAGPENRLTGDFRLQISARQSAFCPISASWY